mmetsp:Transcript_121436/g.259289  ORF Transcript_121436/g.259289 Transcript_121436/m.259289 type:complete len:241 (+) Transcript_121436:139-861(+)
MVLLLLQPLGHVVVGMVADGRGHFAYALVVAIEAPLDEDRFLHLESDVLEAQEEDRALVAGVSRTLAHTLLEPLLAVGLCKLVHQVSGQGSCEVNVSLQRFLGLGGSNGLLFLLLLVLHVHRRPVWWRCLELLRRFLELLVAVDAEDAGLECLSEHLLRALLVFDDGVLNAFALGFAVAEDVFPVRAPLRDILEMLQRLLRVLELAHALLRLHKPVPSLVILVVNLQGRLRRLQGGLEKL